MNDLKLHPPPSKKSRLDDTVSSSTSDDVTESLTEFEKRILTLGTEFPKGIPNKIIQNDSPTVKTEERASAINKLLGLGLLDLYKQGNELIYKVKSNVTGPKSMTGADEEERVVYDIIGCAENKGIWIRDIRFKSNLTMPQLNKVLKSLENKRLIKTVKSVAAAKKKVYMLFELEPDRSLSGGAFYSDQEFEFEFVTVLSQQCYRYLENKSQTAREKRHSLGPLAAERLSSASLEEIWDYIKNLGISKVELSAQDIESILQTLVYDDKVELCETSDTKIYTARPPFGRMLGNDSFPCGICPVAQDCTEDGPINPKSCTYLSNWIHNTAYQF